MKGTTKNTPGSTSGKTSHQEPFSRVAPALGSALLLGAGVGFALATVLTLSLLLHVPIGTWWISTA